MPDFLLVDSEINLQAPSEVIPEEVLSVNLNDESSENGKSSISFSIDHLDKPIILPILDGIYGEEPHIPNFAILSSPNSNQQ